jgi:hypothetical protein
MNIDHYILFAEGYHSWVPYCTKVNSYDRVVRNTMSVQNIPTTLTDILKKQTDILIKFSKHANDLTLQINI